MRILLAVVVLSTMAAFSGCLSTEEEPLSDTSFSLTVTDVPQTVAANQTFTVQMTALSLSNLEHSDHVGAHFWTAPVTDPNAAFAQSVGCVHLEGGADLPGGPWTITCTAPATAGTIQIRGHARLTTEAATFNYWSMDEDIVVTA